MSQEITTPPDRSTEDLILDAARKVFTRKGYAAARMEDIAKEAGMNRALLHYYYRSKERLFEMVFEENMRKFYGSFISILTTDAPFEIRLRTLVAAEIDMLLTHPELPLFILGEIARDPELIQDKLDLLPIRQFMQTFSSTLQAEMDKGTIRRMEPVQVLMHLLSLCVFPFAAKPMFLKVSGMPQEQFQTLMIARKQIVADTLLTILKP